MKEIDLKIKLINHLITDCPRGLSLGTEVRFKFGSRRADVVTLVNDVVTVYEIKSAGDSISRLPEQLTNYKEYFDYCYIVCVKENISAIRNIISRNVGLILIDDNMVVEVRKSKPFLRHNKLSLACDLSSRDLKEKLNLVNVKAKSKFELCILLSKNYSLSEIRAFSRESLKKSLEGRYELFISELGQVITPDDLLTISRMPSGGISLRPKNDSTAHKIVHPDCNPK